MRQAESIVPAAMLEFLRWVAAEQRSYADAMEAWQTSCPRLSVFEDASIAGFTELRRAHGQTWVVLTNDGRAVLESA